MTSPTTATTDNPLRGLLGYGQSVWLDYIRRSLITSGELQRLITEDGLRGVTSNPSIFEKAIAGSTDYQDILDSTANRNLGAKALYEKIAIRDVCEAADALRPVYEHSNGRDGYISLEVSPFLAHDTKGTMEEARRLWNSVSRPNLMIKVPGTPEGMPAIRSLIGEGTNVNVTLLFSQSTYEQVADAFIAGLEDRLARGQKVSGIASVASFFISRIDAAIDSLIEGRLKQAGDAGQRGSLRSLLGKVAIANAKLTYQVFHKRFAGDRWMKLEKGGAQRQRLLWASTSSKNANYRDVIYVEELIGAETVNTVPPQTLNAFRDHGRLRASLTEDVESAYDVMETLAKVGISMEQVTSALVTDGLQQFTDAFTRLLEATAKRAGGSTSVKVNRQSYKLPPAAQRAVEVSLAEWRARNKAAALWGRDSSLWTGAGESDWLGWLGITDVQLANCHVFTSFTEWVKSRGFKHTLLLGMGGSSLCPEVLRLSFGRIDGYPDFHVLDSTDPAQVKAVEQRLDLGKTLFIVSSKSGGTLEPNIFKQYFFERAKQAVGGEEVGNRFVAITDPGSKMQHVAEHDQFHQIFYGDASIGGRYSALSNFGMIPAAAMGIDVPRFLQQAEEMVHACGPTVPPEQNPGVILGTILGTLGKQGRDKVTIFTSPGISDLGAWLEQLLAESTGKIGKGLIPVDRESIGAPEVYGSDRVFVYLRLDTAADPEQDKAIEALELSGQPVVRIAMDGAYNLGEEFFRWEVATAVAGAILGINAFNQPDVETSKIATRQLTTEYEQTGSLPPETPFFKSDGIQLFADERNTAALKQSLKGDQSIVAYLKAHLSRLAAGDYFAILGYVEMNDAHERALQMMRHSVRDAKKVATCMGFGPRFLHSTGQAYKGGPNSGVFLQVTCDDAADVEVPGQKYTFGLVKTAQSRGDFQVLAERGRRALRVHIGNGVDQGLKRLSAAIEEALR